MNKTTGAVNSPATIVRNNPTMIGSMIPAVILVATAVAPQSITANSAAAGTATVSTVEGGVPTAIAAASTPERFSEFGDRFFTGQAYITEHPVIQF